jgi:dTDP-4-dehydrorhamnose reductase
MKKLLITGSNGLLGQKLTDLLLAQPSTNLQWLATARGANRHPQLPEECYHSLDLTDPAAVEALFAAHAFTDVIHTAAMTQVDDCELNPEACHRQNIDTVATLVRLCREYGSRLIFVSTDFIFRGDTQYLTETAAPGPLSVYGHSKWTAERLIQASGIRHAIARTVLVYGWLPDLSRSNIVLWLRKSLLNGQTVRVVDDQFRTPTLAEDLADGVFRILGQNATGIWHLSGAEGFYIYDLAQAVAQHWGLNGNLIERTSSAVLSQPAKRPPLTGFDITKARTELGYAPHTLSQGLDLLIQQGAR